MKTILSPRRDHYLARVSIFLIMLALIAGMVGCSLFSQNLEIRDWHDLNAVRDKLGGHYILMNDLDSTTAGYEELASPTANDGKGWHPIIGAGGDPPFTGTFDGQGYEIRDMFINLPGIGYVGLFSIVGEGGRIEDIGVVNSNVTSTAYIGSLVGVNLGTVSNSYSTGSVTGNAWVGGLVGFNFEEATVSNSYSTGSVTSEYGAGGLAGGNAGTVSNSYSTGSVTGNEGVGGLVGANNGTVSNSYSTGSVTGDSSVGGLVGYSEGTVSDSFWDTETSGQATPDGGTGKTPVEMKNIATFLGADWSIVLIGNYVNETWYIDDGNDYPRLGWQHV